MDLKTEYLGLTLDSPLMVGASPLADDLDTVRRLEDAGSAAIVMRSLFEEQLVHEQLYHHRSRDLHAESSAEALHYFPEHDGYALDADEYLDHLRRVRDAVSIPVIGSLNGVTDSGWVRYARAIEETGVDALELNFYGAVTDPHQSAVEVEDRLVALVTHLKGSTTLPVAVKLSPFYTALPHLAKRLVDAGVAGLILFNRFYQPDIDIEALEVSHELHLSSPEELLLRLRWLAILSGQIQTSYAVTGGVHDADDALKAIMAGAHAVQLVSAVLRNGPQYLGRVGRDLREWLEEHEYESLDQARGSMNLARTPDPAAYERGNYVKLLQTWRANTL